MQLELQPNRRLLIHNLTAKPVIVDVAAAAVAYPKKKRKGQPYTIRLDAKVRRRLPFVISDEEHSKRHLRGTNTSRVVGCTAGRNNAFRVNGRGAWGKVQVHILCCK